MKNYKILIVDDALNWRRAIARMIKSNLGINCFHAENGMEAINKITSENLDLVLLDYEMPKMNGLEVLEKIKNSSNLRMKNTSIIMMTGVAEESKIKQILQMEIVDYILKPFDKATVINRIKTVLDRNIVKPINQDISDAKIKETPHSDNKSDISIADFYKLYEEAKKLFQLKYLKK